MHSRERIIKIEVELPVSRLDKLLVKSIPELSRSQIQKLIRQGNVTISSGQTVRANSAIQPSEVVTVHLPAEEPERLQPEAIPLDILFEDDDLIVLNKPAGMVVHPAQGHSSGTVVNALLSRYPDLFSMCQIDANSANRPGIVHRLDRDTSGLMVVTRTPSALHHLRRQFKARTVKKVYLALVFGCPEAPAGIIDVPLGRDPLHRQKFAPLADGKPSRTDYRIIDNFDKYSLLEINLHTGRTHQIRVHLAWLKIPVVGDVLYGRRKNRLGLTGQFLHAYRLSFQHPSTGKTVELEAPLSDDLQLILDQLRGE